MYFNHKKTLTYLAPNESLKGSKTINHNSILRIISIKTKPTIFGFKQNIRKSSKIIQQNTEKIKLAINS